MNIILQFNNFDDNAIYFQDTKRNIIMDGDFTKIIYSDDCVSLNGIYVNCPLLAQPVNKVANKNMIWFQPYNPENAKSVSFFIELEKKILQLYKHRCHCNKKQSLVLYNQLYSGTTKIYKEQNMYNGQDQESVSTHSTPSISNNVNSFNKVPNSFTKVPELGRSPTLTFGSRLAPNGVQSLQYGNVSILSRNDVEKSGACRMVQYIIKISGVWESNDSIGINYKFLENPLER